MNADVWKPTRGLLATILATSIVISASQQIEEQRNTTELTEFATRYAAAWSGQDPEAFASFEDGHQKRFDSSPRHHPFAWNNSSFMQLYCDALLTADGAARPSGKNSEWSQ